ncbi:glycosyltransferase [Bacteroides sp. AN502(2024)]|uniref:glycosyltransferase n=1 Tax=Bacteroides sp. AN502(2024) TaxID=3160599 RepID=UPI003512FC66
MKPRIFISMHYLEIGGAETSLIGLLKALDPARVEVDLFLHAHRGELMRFIPPWVNLLPEIPVYAFIERPLTEALRHGFLRLVWARLRAKWHFHRYIKRKRPTDGSAIFGYIGRYVTPTLPSLRGLGTYDLAISFLTPHDLVLRKVSARKRVAWIHTDYTRIDVDGGLELPVWNGYDYIASVSVEVTKTFLREFPTLADKVIEIENILSPAFVRKRADEEPLPADMARKDNETILLTIGRYSFPKKLEEIPLLCRLLIEKGQDIKWYIIGYGGSDLYIRRAISAEGMEGRVVLLGKRVNPYPYIKACDWYVQPSRYEGKSVVVREAQMLGRPVIITAYPTAASQVTHGVDGVVVPLPAESCAEGMSRALTNETLRQSIISHLVSHDYGNETEVNKVIALIG